MTPEQVVQLSTLRRLAASGKAKQIREANHITSGEMALALDIAAPTLWRWEKGERQPRGDAALRWAQLLGNLLDANAKEQR